MNSADEGGGTIVERASGQLILNSKHTMYERMYMQWFLGAFSAILVHPWTTYHQAVWMVLCRL